MVGSVIGTGVFALPSALAGFGPISLVAFVLVTVGAHDVLDASNRSGVRFMHCLPAIHNRGTAVGARLHQQFGLDGAEVTEEVFESKRSIVFDQAENRMHTIKALLVQALAG